MGLEGGLDTTSAALAAPAALLDRLKEEWRTLPCPQATPGQVADGYAQAVTFGLLSARAQDLALEQGSDKAIQRLAAKDVAIADAATGPGTFLLGLLQRIAVTIVADRGALPGASSSRTRWATPTPPSPRSRRGPSA